MAEKNGRYTQLSQEAVKENMFKGVELHAGKVSDKKLSKNVFFLSLARNVQSRMLSTERREVGSTRYDTLIEEFKVLCRQYWPDSPEAFYGETEVESLCTCFGIDCVHPTVRAFRCFIDSNGKDVQKEMSELLAAVDTMAISSAECKRGFSQINLVCTATRASLNVSTISSLLFINLVGPPLAKFNPVPYVKSWIAKSHRSATNTQSKVRSCQNDTEGMDVLWALLDN